MLHQRIEPLGRLGSLPFLPTKKRRKLSLAKNEGTNVVWGVYALIMTIAQSGEPTPQKPLRLWPGVVAVVLQWLAFYGVPIVMSGPAAGYIAPLGGLVGGLAVIVWWVFFSRAPR